MTDIVKNVIDKQDLLHHQEGYLEGVIFQKKYNKHACLINTYYIMMITEGATCILTLTVFWKIGLDRNNDMVGGRYITLFSFQVLLSPLSICDNDVSWHSSYENE